MSSVNKCQQHELLRWLRIHVDFAEPYKGEMFVVVIDAYSKWLAVHHMRSTTSGPTIEKLRELFATHGLPAVLVSDNGSNVTSAEFEELMKLNGIRHIHAAPNLPHQMVWPSRQCERLRKDSRR